jgi:Tol biopolymer transport system component
MTSRRYLNFDLLLEQEADGQYQALVTGSPLGETPSVRFKLPFDATTLENLLLKLDPGRSGTRRVGGTSQQQATMDFGGPLYAAIFRDDVLLAWSRSQDMARQQDAGLRLRLRLKDAPAISGLPWELLYDAKSNNFLAQSERTPVVRFLDVPQVPRPMAVDGPLRVLAIISSPTDLDELDVEAEWQRIGEALAPRVTAGLVVIDRLPSATIAELGAWLRRHPTHVIHFVGHGDFDDRLREGVVYFQDEHGRSSPVTSSVLGPYLRDHDPLRMVVLNACRSARTDAVDPFGGIAQGLVQQDATAVVAMQFPISDRAAVTFTGEFYGALVDGLPVDQAVSSARKALQAEFRDEWATPVLFLRSPDGNIFENVHADASVVPAGPGEVPPGEVHPGPPGPPEPPEPPGPSYWKSVAGFVSSHRKLVFGAAAGVVAVVVAVLVIAQLRDDDFEPFHAVLPNSTLLVAAGDRFDNLHIYKLEARTGDEGLLPLTTGDTNEFNPVLSPDRDMLIYSRKRESGNQLRAMAIDGSGDRPLFDESSLKECSGSTGRPAWIPGTEELVMRCFGSDKFIRLVGLDIHGNFLDTYDDIEPGDKTQDFGHPAVSPDGTTAVYPIATGPKSREGALFAIKLDTHQRTLLLAPEGKYAAFGDPVFSPSGDMLAWRATTTLPELGSEVLAAPLVDGELDMDNLILVSGDVAGDDLDPMFSPDGRQIAYTHSPPDDPATTDVVEPEVIRELWLASVANPDDRDRTSGAAHTFYAGPAWTRR